MRLARRSIAALGIATGALSLALTLGLAAPAAASASSVRLMIDPGHGGSDPGAEGPGLQEKDSNLTIGGMVEQAARRQGWDVAKTRGSDAFVGLVERPQSAAAFRATDFVSIHSNSTGNAAEGNMTIYRTAGGARLGASIMRELDPLTPYADIGNRADVRGLAVLRHATMPNAVLVELLSVTAPAENAALKDPARQREMAEAVVRGIARYHNVRYYPPASLKPAAAAPAPAPARTASRPVTEAPATATVETPPAAAAAATAAPAAKAPAPPAPAPAPVAAPAPQPAAPAAPAFAKVTATAPVDLPWPTVGPESSPWPSATATPQPAPEDASGALQHALDSLSGTVIWLFR